MAALVVSILHTFLVKTKLINRSNVVSKGNKVKMKEQRKKQEKQQEAEKNKGGKRLKDYLEYARAIKLTHVSKRDSIPNYNTVTAKARDLTFWKF